MPVDTWEQSAYRIFEDGLIDVEIQRNSSYSLWNQELGQTILMCPYDEVHLLSKGYEELEQAIDALNVENANYMGVFYGEWKDYMEGRIETGNMFAKSSIHRNRGKSRSSGGWIQRELRWCLIPTNWQAMWWVIRCWNLPLRNWGIW